ncbi:MotB family protein [Chelativorans sp. AA-79]|uniref:MotB family protein n=1 Tax=Chelativorans sp. AA-79 TaxID=3028735 RepID=UPI0023F6705D|nr:MotB family protein [Chelativorans sp. AA-79]WEX08318.1 MotB family protein [Chelativorans sp. AA-79]
MTAGNPEERHPEIIIVRRGGDDEEEGHHGGVWKIAFADFMTAMMCFFLVMWLINAANEQTRAALASYFNPVKLIDRNTNRKGLEEIGQGPQTATEADEAQKITDQPAGEHDKTSGPANFQNASDLADTRKYSDENFFSNPYAVLAEIAAESGKDQNVSARGEGGQQIAGPSSGASGGEAYRDPFAPDFWSQQVAVPQIGVEGDPDEAREQPAGADRRARETGAYELAAAAPEADTGREDEVLAIPLKPVPQAEPLAGAVARQSADDPKTAIAAADEGEADANSVKETADATKAAKERQVPSDAREAEAEALRQALTQALKGEGLAGSVAVSAGDEGVMISVTDDVRNGMFAVGSAVPERSLVLAMEKIGKTLAEQPGTVRIHGHTDARPFKGGSYDNWRLSTARAHAAQYMLVRGGLEEDRIAEVAGFADRRLKLPENPLADANRRIEILLEAPR